VFFDAGIVVMGRNSIPGWGTVVHTVTVGMVWRARVFSDAGIAVMGSIGVTMLHPQGPRDPELPRCLRWHRPHRRTPRGWCAMMETCCAPFQRIRRVSPIHGERDLGGQGD
jgi:hypothetical protein